ncbi:MAG: hypothetical protein ACI379_13310 [Nocardioides sp.]|uniref:hypothetical protein n=1 Tax=Nocardioides sp. TaxID=35761 RepID=UPI003EFF41AF
MTDDRGTTTPTGENEAGYATAAGHLALDILRDTLVRGAMLLCVLVFGAGLADQMPWRLVGPVAGFAGFGTAMWLMSPRRSPWATWTGLLAVYAIGAGLLVAIWS